MTFPSPSRPSASPQFTPLATPGRRAFAVLGSSAVVAFVSFAVSVLAYFIGEGHSPSVFAQIGSHFAVASLIVWALLAVVNAVGATRTRVLAAVSGLTSSVLAAFIATTMSVAANGSAFSIQAVLFVVGSLVSLNLVFIITVVMTEMLLAPRVMRDILAFRPVRAPRRLAIVRIPASNLAEGEVSFHERASIDQSRADAQWDNYCAALVAEGWETLEVAATPDLADSVFVEDMVVVFGDLAVLASPGAESRRAERDTVEATIAAIPGLTLAAIEAPGTLDGGDVLKIGSTVYVGASQRTNAEGIRQLRVLLTPIGYDVVAVPLTKALHLKSVVTALPDGTVIGDPERLDTASLFPRFLPVHEAEGVAVVHLSDETLLMSAAAPGTASMLAGLGYRVVTVDISEFEKLEGCVTCLSVRVR